MISHVTIGESNKEQYFLAILTKSINIYFSWFSKQL